MCLELRESTENDFERRILDLLSRELMSISQVSRRIGMRRDVTAGYLEALKNQGKLKFFKVGRSYVYKTTDRGEE